ncbi:MAG TPA: TonB-dependent receptor [Gemmatimonadaceae bacterium]|nr:TonB-dependent receptor [Gemmatimonadaceae bacterium]
MPHVPRSVSRAAVLAVAAMQLASPLATSLRAQQPVRPDSARRDTATVQRLPGVTVTGTLREERLEGVPWAVGAVGTTELRRAQPTVSLDEALTLIPGVYIANRYNFAVDSRIAVRGFGSRANFGVRGVRVVLDGISQTLPDGQSQTTNVELGALERVEVLRGASSALYGNGSGGVVSFTSDLRSPTPFRGTLRVEGGSFGMRKWQARTNGRTERAAGMLSLTQFTWDGFRQHSSADVRQLNAGVDYAVSPTTTASVRLNLADMPEAFNPGALTAAEYEINPDTAALSNVLRGSDKRTKQNQLSLRLQRASTTGIEVDASAFALTRDVRNALAVAPPAPSGPNNGTYATLDREVYGARLSGARRLGVTGPRVVAGVEWQRMEDLRENRRATSGRPTEPTDTLLLSQVEAVSNAGIFAQAGWSPMQRVGLSAGARYDAVRFTVDDRFASDGVNSGGRTLPAWSGHLGLSWAAREALASYANVSTSFETPTTTELQTRADGLGGFNADLSPQRARSVELGARGQLLATRVSYDVALFRTWVDDAIVPYLETNGRAYFTNAGATRNDGLEAGLSARVSDAVQVEAAYTWAHYRFADYRVVRGATTDTLDGRTLPGVPEHFLRVGLRTRPLAGVTLDVDHTVSSSLFADDANALRVEGWGPGVTAVRGAWDVQRAGYLVQPFVGVANVFDVRYVSTVTVNGFGGRVLEPAPGRNFYVGVEMGWGR